MIKSINFYKIIALNLIPLAAIYLLNLSIFYFLYYFLFEGILFILFSSIKLFKLFSRNNQGSFSALFSSLIFMLLKGAIMLIPMVFLFAIAANYYPYGKIRLENAYEPLVNEPLIFVFSFLKVVMHHIGWVKSNAIEQFSLKYFFYSTLLKGFGGLMVLLIVSMALDQLLVTHPFLIAISLTLILLLYSLWDEYGSKKWFGAKTISHP